MTADERFCDLRDSFDDWKVPEIKDKREIVCLGLEVFF
jgi:hypothetical protein